ncbi:MAG: RnfABCDGE type electron transport complex subunit A [Planctomycetota bacterium]
MEFFTIIISLVFINNFVLAKILGLCPFIGVSGKMKDSISMGVAVTFVMAMASAVTFIVFQLLKAYHLEFMTTIFFILVIAALVQFVEMVIQKTSPALYRALGIYLPLITTNCTVLGVAILNVQGFNTGPFAINFLKAILQGTAAGVGFTMAMLLMAGIRERFEIYDMPASVKGAPIAFICAGLMALAFLGFGGMV